jgi:hypothetical protein
LESDITSNKNNHVLGALKTKVDVAKENSASLSEKEKLEHTVDSLNLIVVSLKDEARNQHKKLREDERQGGVNMGDLCSLMQIQNSAHQAEELTKSFMNIISNQTRTISSLARSISDR